MPNVNIYHGGFHDEDVYKCVFSYTDGVSINDKEILSRAFEMFNAPYEYLSEEDQAIFAYPRVFGTCGSLLGRLVDPLRDVPLRGS